MTEPVDQEIEAIKNVLQALTPLSARARTSVLDYVVKRLDIVALDVQHGQSNTTEEPGRKGQDTTTPPPQGDVHIKTLKEQKKPRSANEMAALVAYYLGNLVPETARQKTVGQKDMETYFKIAEFPLPQQIRVTLPNAKAAGYFDSAGEGEYKLNAVGHNLVVHSMPRGKSVSGKPTRIRKTAIAKRTKSSRTKRT